MFTVSVTNNSSRQFVETMTMTVIPAGDTVQVVVDDLDRMARNVLQWNALRGFSAISYAVVSGCPAKSVVEAGLTQADGAVTIDVSTLDSSAIQVAFDTVGTVTTGSATLQMRCHGSGELESVNDSTGTPITVNFPAPKTVVIDNARVVEIVVTPSGFDGDSYGVTVTAV